jgi:hypothetical protein
MSSRLRTSLVVIGAWILIALAWTPPTIFLQRSLYLQHGIASDWLIFADVVLGFLPWMAATPLIFWLGRR